MTINDISNGGTFYWQIKLLNKMFQTEFLHYVTLLLSSITSHHRLFICYEAKGDKLCTRQFWLNILCKNYFFSLFFFRTRLKTFKHTRIWYIKTFFFWCGEANEHECLLYLLQHYSNISLNDAFHGQLKNAVMWSWHRKALSCVKLEATLRG